MQHRYTLELPNDLQLIERSVAYLMERGTEAGFDEDRLRLNFRVGLTEALTNAMLYGSADPGKRVRLEADFTEDAITVRVTDQGSGFDPRKLKDPTLPRNIWRPGGRGIFLIRKLMDEVEFNERGNSIRMVLRREPRRPAETG